MCEDHHPTDPLIGDDASAHHLGGSATPHHALPGRRALLGGMVAAVSAPMVLRGGPASAAAPSLVSGQRAVVAAMHMHGSFSEQQGSWQGQAWRMVQESVDLMFMTDHSHSLVATEMAADLRGTAVAPITTGALRRQRASVTTGRVSLLAESDGDQPASSGMWTDLGAKANELAIRTSVMGQVVHHTFGPTSVSAGGVYEVRVGLSHHPAVAGRAEGIYGLCFRFGPGLARSTALEDGGRTAVVTAPLPASGTMVDLDLRATCAAAWPDLVPEDNATVWFSFTAVSPRAGVAVDVTVRSVTFERAPRTNQGVIAVQQVMADRYSRDYGLTVVPSIELGNRAHHNAYTATPYFAPDEMLGYTDPTAYARSNVSAVHALGGVVSYNHPYGAAAAPLATGAAAVTLRRSVYSSLAKVDVYGADILEVGYALRGGMGIDGHVDLWDTFSRNGRFLTGNGVSDSHDSSTDRRRQGNEFVTGLWSSSTTMADVLPALASGRVFTRHVSFWAGGELDLVVDGTILMGQVVVAPASTRRLTITATKLPAGSVVEVVAGPVDYQGVDPGTSVIDTVPASTFGGTGVATRTVALLSSSFVRLTVRDGRGTVIGISNPVWLLDAFPATGIPSARLHLPQ